MSNLNAKKLKLIKPIDFEGVYLKTKLLREDINCLFLSEENKNF